MSELVMMFRRFTWRHWRREWRSTLLLVAILALGVGVFLSIRLANRAAISGFDLFTESISGESDFVVRPVAGTRFSAEVLRELRQTLDPLPVVIFPVIEAGVTDEHAASRRLIGADLVALQNALNLGTGSAPAEANDESGGGGSELGSDRHVFVPRKWVEKAGLTIGSSLALNIGDQQRTIEIAGLLEDDPQRPAIPENMLLMDLPGAQELLGWENSISRVELFIPPGKKRDAVRSETGTRLLDALGGIEESVWTLETRDDRRASAAEMTSAFHLNLTILSTLALLVGTYLILQALEAAVVRRRPEVAILRSLGVAPRAIRRLWLLESLVLGIVGSAIGIGIGWAGAQVTVGGIARTVNSLYYATTTEAASLHPAEALAAFTFGLVASVVAGWLPSRDAASTPPAQMLKSGVRDDGAKLLRRPWIGIVAALSAGLFVLLPPWRDESGNMVPIGGYLSAAAWLLALSILANLLFRGAASFLPTLWGRKPELSYASSQFRRPTGRHRLAVAGLVTAIGMAAGMGILVHSFESTLTGWIGQLLRADLYVAPAGADQAASDGTIKSETWKAIEQDESVEGIDIIRRYPVTFEGRRIQLAGSEYNRNSERRLRLTWLQEPADPDPISLAKADENERIPAWINEPFSRKFGIDRGDEFEIPTPLGARQIRVQGVYADYSDEAGTVLVNRQFTAHWFDDSDVSNLAVYLKPDALSDEVIARWRAQYPALVVRENARLRAEALRVFHQTFAVTYALEAIGVFVAVAGLGLALASLLVERRAELATLKTVGFTRKQIAGAAAIEGAGVAAVGYVGGLILALLLGAVLIFVINRQSFGWTLDFKIPWGLMLGLGMLTLTASALISGLVGKRTARLKSDREE